MNRMSWQINGFKSKEEATLTAIAAVMRYVPGAEISYQSEVWTAENFSKAYLKTIRPKFFKPEKRKKVN